MCRLKFTLSVVLSAWNLPAEEISHNIGYNKVKISIIALNDFFNHFYHFVYGFYGMFSKYTPSWGPYQKITFYFVI